MKNDEMKKETQETKSFSYAKGEVSLSFSLRTDRKEEVKNFLDCLIEAKKAVEEEINEI